MTEIRTGQETEATVRICPNCSSTELSGNDLGGWRCVTCRAQYSEEDLIISKFKHELGSDSDVLQQLVRSLRNTVAKELATTMGAFLLKWGFIDAPDPYLLSRYVNSCARSMLIAIIEERQKIERESHGN